jgi:outer membrane lipoprotein-sorting protein
MIKRTAMILGFLSILAASAFGSPIDEIKKSQKDIKSVKASFRQEKHTELFQRPIKSEGTFYFMAGKGVRWEYGTEMVVVYDGESLYLHYVELEEAEKVNGVSGFVGPLSFDITQLVMHLIPKKQVPFESMEMVFPKGAAFPSLVKIVEQTGDRTEIHFDDVEENPGLDSTLFQFVPPPGVTLRERVLR